MLNNYIQLYLIISWVWLINCTGLEGTGLAMGDRARWSDPKFNPCIEVRW